MDNCAPYKTPRIKAWLSRRPHWPVRFTPISASWAIQVERRFADLTRKRLLRGLHRSVAELEVYVSTFIEARNVNPKPCNWVKSADEILESVRRFCQRTQQTLRRELWLQVTGPTSIWAATLARDGSQWDRDCRWPLLCEKGIGPLLRFANSVDAPLTHSTGDHGTTSIFDAMSAGFSGAP